MKNREKAIKWFNLLTADEKSKLSNKYYKETVNYNFTCLTGREIEEMWINEIVCATK